MSTHNTGTQSGPVGIILTTSIVAFISGFALGVFTIRGYLVSPSLSAERRANYEDPIESEESDIDDDTLLDHAPNWGNSLDADRRQGLRVTSAGTKKKAKKAAAKEEEKLVDVSEGSGPAAAADMHKTNEECKLVLVVRTDLGMTKGKIAAQASHATLACFKSLSRFPAGSPQAQLLKKWERAGQAKIAVQVKSQQELMDLKARARSLGLTAEVIADAGRTQIEAGSFTVLGVGPGPKSVIDQVTGGLKLL
ncbi:PTH2 family peptidyl-tRNA hydrolase [Apiospora hydei]|uniref:peptidyl-tRNA hydrolase n=1 Tax=Apiospora hydei TaxID=1337664 RepID=A0ABR1XB69_9PEZI